MTFWRWLTRRPDLAVSRSWIAEHELRMTKIGWDGPRWRRPFNRARDYDSPAWNRAIERQRRRA